MADEKNRVDIEELEGVSGGRGGHSHHKTGHRDSIADCPPGTIEVRIMADEKNRVDIEELEGVSGGRGGHSHHKTGHRDSIADCPPGTIEVKNEQLPNKGEKKHHCINCENKHGLEDHFFYMVDTQTLVEGQSCPKCGAKWITHG